MNDIARTEHPFPQMVRDKFINLNGKWEFEIDNEMSGKEKGYNKREKFNREINVPFCPESRLSGIGNTDFMNCVWYRREFTLPSEFGGGRTILHFGAVDYSTAVYINGKAAGTHKGGYTSFAFDITEYLTEGTNVITVCAEDDGRSLLQPTGKQSDKYNSYNCFYTRTTGIWQTVWLESAGSTYIKNFRTYSDIDNGKVTFNILTDGTFADMSLAANVTYNGENMGSSKAKMSGSSTFLTVDLKEKHLWAPGEGNLYDAVFAINDKEGKTIDSVKCYFGLRTVSMSEKGLCINGNIVFGRFVLDQGFYPEGIYTAPTDDALRRDIEDSLAFGFNGARLHQKVFEPRFLYWADKLGYMVWGEYANWGIDASLPQVTENFLPEWLEAVERDFSHPSVIGWCPFNETWDVNGSRQDDKVILAVYQATKAADPTRPVIDTSGNFHVLNYDLYDVHDYEQDAEKFISYYAKLKDGEINDQTERDEKTKGRQKYNGEPVFMSEYGGIRWTDGKTGGWGYGNAPGSEEEFKSRFKDLTEAMMSNDKVFALCYTQLYDVEQEQNGLMTYERKEKFKKDFFRSILKQKAAIEKT